MDKNMNRILCAIIIGFSFAAGWLGCLHLSDFKTEVTMSGGKLYYNNDGTDDSSILKHNNNSWEEQKEKIDKINLNTATTEELMDIPYVGEKTAEKIIAYRNNNPFKDIEELLNIKGIGEKTYAKIKDYVYVGDSKVK